MPQTLIERERAVRLIASARLKPRVMNPLVDNHDELSVIEFVEGLTNDRLTSADGEILDVTREELVPQSVPGHSFINASFTHPSPNGNRFNGSKRGAWYAAYDVETSLAEVSFHLTRELKAINRLDATVDYAELIAEFSGEYEDLRGCQDEPCLHENTTIGYPEGQRLADIVRMDGRMGILYPSVRHPGGTCLVALRPSAIEGFVQGGLWRLRWEGTENPMITCNPT